MTAPLNPPPTRILSWQQMVLEADPSYQRLSRQPWVYEFSNGRLFVDPSPLYDFSGITAGVGDNNSGGGPGVLFLTDATGWPTAPSGPDLLWSNGGEPTIPPGFPALSPPLLPLRFGYIDSAGLLATPPWAFPMTAPSPGSGVLWNPNGFNGGPIFVA